MTQTQQEVAIADRQQSGANYPIGQWVVLAFGSNGTQIAQVWGYSGAMLLTIKFSAKRRRFTQARWTLTQEVVGRPTADDFRRLKLNSRRRYRAGERLSFQ